MGWDGMVDGSRDTTPLRGVHIESAGDLWLSLHRSLPATFSPLLWQALIDMLSSVIGERKGRD